MKAGLRIDVDTWRGTKIGVPNLCRLLKARDLHATFYFSLGPDNMGRHLWRLFRPAFLLKMLRSRAASLYGWEILLRGTFWPGPQIGKGLAKQIRAAADEGHEIGVHAWDHQAWQSKIDRMGAGEVDHELRRAFDELEKITGRPPVTSAVPGWKANALVLERKAAFPFAFNSDCRGHSVFIPEVDGKPLQWQVPVTLPTYDEAIGMEGMTDATYNDWLLDQFREDRLNVLTIHAEVEGDSRMQLFDAFLEKARSRGIEWLTLGEIARRTEPERGRLLEGKMAGREGWVAFQSMEEGSRA